MSIKNKYFVNEIFAWNESKYYEDTGEHYNCWRGAYIVVRDFLLLDEFRTYNDLRDDGDLDIAEDCTESFIQYLVDYGYMNPLTTFEVETNDKVFRNVTLNQTVRKDNAFNPYSGNEKYILVPKQDLNDILTSGIKASMENPLVLYNTEGSYHQEEIEKVISISNNTLVKIKIRILPSNLTIITDGKELYIEDIVPEQIIRD